MPRRRVSWLSTVPWGVGGGEEAARGLWRASFGLNASLEFVDIEYLRMQLGLALKVVFAQNLVGCL